MGHYLSEMKDLPAGPADDPQVQAAKLAVRERYSIQAGMDAFQEYAVKTAVYQHTDKIRYPTLGLCGEAGEVANKVKKLYRDGGGLLTQERQADIAAEIGDVLWYCAALARDINVPLGQIARRLIEKLADRKARGTIHGSGDSR